MDAAEFHSHLACCDVRERFLERALEFSAAPTQPLWKVRQLDVTARRVRFSHLRGEFTKSRHAQQRMFMKAVLEYERLLVEVGREKFASRGVIREIAFVGVL